MIVNPILNGEAQEAPAISVSAGGLITATAGDKSATQQLPTQESKTVTPGTSTKTAVASGRYTTGNVNVAGSANLVPANIKSGVNIFGVTGAFEGGTPELVTGTILGATGWAPANTKYLFTDGNTYHSIETSRNSSDTIHVLKNSIIAADSKTGTISGGIKLVDGVGYFVTGHFTIQAV